MTSFLRTRKDRHPKPENKSHRPHEHDQFGVSMARDITQQRDSNHEQRESTENLETTRNHHALRTPGK